MARRRSSFDDDDAPLPAVASPRASLLADAPITLSSAADYVAEISRLWAETQRRFLEIGRHLNQAKERLPHGEFLPMIERDLPFGRGVANRLMAVAEAVDSGALPQRLLPPSYSTAYLLAKMSPDERAQANGENLFRTTVTREEIVSFLARVRSAAQPAAGKARQELRRLERKEARLAASLTAIKARVAELRKQLGDEPD